MTKRTKSEVHRTKFIRPEDVQEMFGIKKVAYYNRLKFLEIQAHKDENNKAYLDDSQLELLKQLDEYISVNGKMTGFTYSKKEIKQEVSLVLTEENNLTASTNNSATITNHSSTIEPDIYVAPSEPTAQFNMEQLIYEAAQLKARELAMQDLVKRALADGMQEEDLPAELKQKVNLAREAANPKFTPQEVAGSLLTQWRQNHLAG